MLVSPAPLLNWKPFDLPQDPELKKLERQVLASMSVTTNSSFGAKTEALTVAAAFPSSIRDRTILITGVNKLGIGYTTAEAFASQSPRTLILTGRSPAKVQECIDSLQARYPNVGYRLLEVDLSSQASVRAAAATVLSWNDVPKIDMVVNNAGIMCVPKRTLTEDGVELHMATNHIGPFLLTNLLMPKILAAARQNSFGTTRIINVSSAANVLSALRPSDVSFSVPFSQLPKREQPNFNLLHYFKVEARDDMSYVPFVGYAHSKTANILFSVALNNVLYEKYGILSVGLHPGEIKSELARNLDPKWYKEAVSQHAVKTTAEGAATTLVAACDPRLTSGSMLKDCQRWDMLPAHTIDKEDSERLWELSEKLVGQNFRW